MWRCLLKSSRFGQSYLEFSYLQQIKSRFALAPRSTFEPLGLTVPHGGKSPHGAKSKIRLYRTQFTRDDPLFSLIIR